MWVLFAIYFLLHIFRLSLFLNYIRIFKPDGRSKDFVDNVHVAGGNLCAAQIYDKREKGPLAKVLR